MLASEPRIRILLPDWIAKSCRLNIQSTRKVAKEAGISRQYVAHAAIVLQYASDQVDAVISGGDRAQWGKCGQRTMVAVKVREESGRVTQ
jgi:hypothetical protein